MERLSKQQLEARDSLVRAIKRAVRVGLKVDHFFVDAEGKLETLETRLTCLRVAVFFAFFDPIALYGIKFYCAVNKVPLELPEAVILWVATLTMVSIVGFGFKLVQLPKWLGGGVNDEVESADLFDDTLSRLRALDPSGRSKRAEAGRIEFGQDDDSSSDWLDSACDTPSSGNGGIENRRGYSTGPSEG